jgi:porphobilinogen synthase
MRRLRQRLVQPMFVEHTLAVNDLVAPLFIDETAEKPVEIGSMPGQHRYPVKDIAKVVDRLAARGIKAVLLFGVPAEKDSDASGAYSTTGVVQEAVRSVKALCPGMVVITDVCACEYTDHGHCGILHECRAGTDLDNDASLRLMEKIAVSHAEAGADIVAPSCMLDGMVTSIRKALDTSGHEETLIMAYSAKFASSLYGPFREAAESGYQHGDRTTYQMNPANGREARMEIILDRDEGADILMVKPAGWYADIIAEASCYGLPVAAYQVSGEYAMIRAAALNGWIDERKAVMESLVSLKRAGASLIITYFAPDVAGWLCEQ